MVKFDDFLLYNLAYIQYLVRRRRYDFERRSSTRVFGEVHNEGEYTDCERECAV